MFVILIKKVDETVEKSVQLELQRLESLEKDDKNHVCESKPSSI